MRDQRVDLNLAVHVPIDDFRDVGAAFRAAKRGALPHPTGYQLKWPGGDFLASAGNPDDDASAPSLVAAFERLTHHSDVADAFKTEVCPALGQIDEVGHQVTSHLPRIHEVGHAEFLGERALL